MFFTISKVSKSLSLSLRLIQIQRQIFLSFSLNLSQRFWSSRTEKTILPFLFWFNLIFHAYKGKFRTYKFFFGDFNDFFQNWSMGFCCWLILTCSLWFNLINLINWEKLEFLGLETTQIWDFVQLSINWFVLLIHFVIIYCYLTRVMINLSIWLDFWKWVFKIWGFCYKLYVQTNSVFLKSNELFSMH